MLKVLSAASLAVLLVVQTSGQGPGQRPTQNAKPVKLRQVWTLDTTYTDRQHGVTFRYPSAWQAETQFGYHPPALTLSATKPIAGFGYSEGGFPRDRIVGPYARTNLEGVGLVYSAVPAASVAECEAQAASLSDSPEHSQVVLGQRSFSVYKTFSGGMSQSMSGELYATYASSICYRFETNVAVASPGVVDDIQTLTAAQLHDIETHLLEIMKSVRIAPSMRK